MHEFMHEIVIAGTDRRKMEHRTLQRYTTTYEGCAEHWSEPNSCLVWIW